MDLLYHKVPRHKGQVLRYLLTEIQENIAVAREEKGLSEHANVLAGVLEKLDTVLTHLMTMVQSEGPEAYLADAIVFLEFFGIITIA